MDKRFWAIIGVIVVVFVGIVVLNGNKNDAGSSGNSKPTSHVRGNLASKVTLTEYGDYECSVCEGYFTTMQQVQQKYNDTVKFQFRNLPLPPSLHPNALAGARAAEAADMQGKFWEMNTALYTQTNWSEWSTSKDPEPMFWNYAQSLGLNITKFKKDFASSTANNRIQADVAAFAKTGQDKATPTFFVNGKYTANGNFVVNNVPSIDAFSKVLDAALKKAQ